MINEAQVLKVVKSVTNTNAYFSNGTLVLETADSKIAVSVFNAIWESEEVALVFGKSGNETVYEFLA